MARPRQFDAAVALDAALGLFREHGYAGTSAEMLSAAMQIGKQSLYNTFGDKWSLYCSALERYSSMETAAHIATLRSRATALAGIEAMMERVVVESGNACLGVGSLSEFGLETDEGRDLSEVRKAPSRLLTTALTKALRQAAAEGDVFAGLEARHAAAFLLANVAGIRLAARGGASTAELRAMAQLAIRALRSPK